jgi:hypothetical protein
VFDLSLAPCDADVGGDAPETAATWEQEGVATGEGREIIGVVDETFLEHMGLVLLDLPTRPLKR